MGVRFRKSVKICKGVRVNFSKSGASVSLGGHGHTTNISKRGVRSTISIPGTGISYSTKVSGSSSAKKKTNKAKSKSTRTSTSRPAAARAKMQTFALRMQDDGKVIIEDAYGREITDAATLRTIRASEPYRIKREELEQQRQKIIDEKILDSEAENRKFIAIYKLSAEVDSMADFERRLRDLRPDEYIAEEYEIEMPSVSDIRSELWKEAEENISGGFFAKKARQQYVEEHLTERVNEATDEWEQNRNEFLQEQEMERQAAEAIYQQEYELEKKVLTGLIEGDDEIICDVFDSWIATCELPVEINIAYDWIPENRVMMLDIDLPEIEDLPDTRLTKLASGTLKEKKKSVSQLRGEYSSLVFGLAVFITSNVFNVSPMIEKVLISGYTQRRNKDGDINDDYIYSIKFTRDMFEGVAIAENSPIELCMAAENRCKMTSTALFKAIKPYDSF